MSEREQIAFKAGRTVRRQLGPVAVRLAGAGLNELVALATTGRPILEELPISRSSRLEAMHKQQDGRRPREVAVYGGPTSRPAGPDLSHQGRQGDVGG